MSHPAKVLQGESCDVVHEGIRNRPTGMAREIAPEAALALEHVGRASEAIGARWALIGGQALIAYGVPHDTDDIDVLVSAHDIEDLALSLCAFADWMPLEYRAWERDYVPAAKPTLHRFDDLLLWALPCERVMYSLRASQGLLVQLLAAQHPVEKEMVAAATPGARFGMTIPLAPLGGLLVVKFLVGRIKDVAAIERAAGVLPQTTLDAANAWVRERIPAAANGLARAIEQARMGALPNVR